MNPIATPTTDFQWDTLPYRIGCPVWNCKQWHGEVYPSKSDSRESLHWYSRSFNTVEGNSFFYGLPGLATLTRWCEQSADHFRFAMKFPRAVSHDAKLRDCESSLQPFLEHLHVLEVNERLGPSFLQLGPDFSARYWDRLQRFLDTFPRQLPLAIEFRHPDWFDEGEWEEKANQLLASLDIDRVLFDSSPLNSQEAQDASESQAQRRKPKSPRRFTVTGRRPFVRLIGLNDAEKVLPFWTEWAQQVATWISQGLQPWIFTHAPDDQFAPRLARLFHELVRQSHPDIPSLPDLSLPNFSQGASEPKVKQGLLFDLD